jgi:hypothetical protein
MSAKSEQVQHQLSVEAEVCACCAVAAVDDIKLVGCNGGCDLVKYCSDICQENYREQHEEKCKKRKAELREKQLFDQPDSSHLGECPICFLPLSLDRSKSSFSSCCCKTVCKGCEHADYLSSGGDRCPFCREPVVNGKEENIKRVMKRVKVNDPAALHQMGAIRFKEGDYDSAFKYYTKAAELGDAAAHNNLGNKYYRGEGVEEDYEKAIHHWEKAAIGGHPAARHGLAYCEEKNGNFERAVKHLIIAANLGREESMKELWKYYSAGHIAKEELEDTLRSHKTAIDETKSSQREEAEAAQL